MRRKYHENDDAAVGRRQVIPMPLPELAGAPRLSSSSHSNGSESRETRTRMYRYVLLYRHVTNLSPFNSL